MTRNPFLHRAYLLVACGWLIALCPSVGRATDTPTPTPYGTASSATATPTAVPASLWFSLGSNIARVGQQPFSCRVFLPAPDHVTFTLYDVAGEELLWYRTGAVTDFTWQWDGLASGAIVPPGVYFVAVKTDGGRFALRRFVLLR